jgi:cytochrome P450
MNLALEKFATILRQEAQETEVADSSRPRSFLTEIVSMEPDGLDDLTTMRNLIFIMGASWIDATGLIEWLFKELSDHPNWITQIARAIETVEGVGTDPLSLRCVKETLRLHQSEYLYRRVLQEIPVDDYVIPKDWLLRICVRESHRDPRVFEQPNEFKPERFLDRRYSRTDYSTFGASRVSCLGEHLTLAMGQIFVEELARNVKSTTVEDGPLEFRRWHWRPSSKWRVRMARRDVATLPHRAQILSAT